MHMVHVDDDLDARRAPSREGGDASMDEASSVRVRLEGLLACHHQPEPVRVTEPTLPSLDRYHEQLQGVWERRWLTNQGACHERLEARLAQHLGVEQLCLVSSGTMGLLLSLQMLGIRNCQVLTTPFTFLATTNVLSWLGVEPIFCDIDPATGTLDPAQLEARVTSDTRAILGVHVYGHPCDVTAIDGFAQRYGLAQIYDAAHAFGARHGGRALCDYGDASVLSFHATKLFSTCEGGAVVCRSPEQAERIRQLRNFGILDEVHAVAPGINGKMSELSAAYGLLQLEQVDAEIAARAERARLYDASFRGVPGLVPVQGRPGAEHNHAYYPLRITAEYGLSRDRVQELLAACNVTTRKYFHPLVSRHAWWSHLPSASRDGLPNAERLAEEVLCLPLHGNLRLDTVESIGTLLRELPSAVEG